MNVATTFDGPEVAGQVGTIAETPADVQVHAEVFAAERHLIGKETYKHHRSAALAKWQSLAV